MSDISNLYDIDKRLYLMAKWIIMNKIYRERLG